VIKRSVLCRRRVAVTHERFVAHWCGTHVRRALTRSRGLKWPRDIELRLCIIMIT